MISDACSTSRRVAEPRRIGMEDSYFVKVKMSATDASSTYC